MISYADAKRLDMHGLRQRPPKYACMSQEELVELRRLARMGLPKVRIAELLGKHPDTIASRMRAYQIVIAKPISAGPGQIRRSSGEKQNSS
jgi:IS30 family transposase